MKCSEVNRGLEGAKVAMLQPNKRTLNGTTVRKKHRLKKIDVTTDNVLYFIQRHISCVQNTQKSSESILTTSPTHLRGLILTKLTTP